MNHDELMEKMLQVIEDITKAIPKEHQAHIFWSPKTNTDAGKVEGFRLYAYGGYVLRIFIDDAGKSLHYETNYRKYKDYFGSSWDEERIGESKVYKRIDTLLDINKIWNPIMEAYKRHMYGVVKNKNLEKGGGTTIARKLELNPEEKNFYFIEQESRIKLAGKKPDLIGVRNVNGKILISFVEYKCTNDGMDGVTLKAHLHDMIQYYGNRAMYVNYYVKAQLELFGKEQQEITRNFCKAYTFEPFGKYNARLGMSQIEYMRKNGFLCMIGTSASYDKYIEPFRDENPLLIYSMWKGYVNPKNLETNDEKLKALYESFPENRRIDLHTSGHAVKEELENMIRVVSPIEAIIPIHTEYKDKYDILEGGENKIKELCDGDIYLL